MTLTNFFRPLRYEPESYAFTALTVVFQLFPNLIKMVFKKMTTKTFAFTAYSETILLITLTNPSYICPTLQGFISMFEFPS
jgi:hypothetical protein